MVVSESTVVERLTNKPKIKGLNPAAAQHQGNKEKVFVSCSMASANQP